MCVCQKGYFQRDCSDTPLRVLVASNVSECGGRALRHMTPGTQDIWCANKFVDATGYTDVQLTILAIPTANVTCHIESSSTIEAQVVQYSGVFPAGSPVGSTVLLQIAGVKDLGQEPPVQFTITAQCESNDIRFDTAAAQHSAYTTDVRFPVVEQIVPMIASYIGQQITITGRDLSNNTVVDVGGEDVSGPLIMRTILLNTTSDELWEVSFPPESAISCWENRTTAFYQDRSRVHTDSARRRKKAPAGGGKSGGGAGGGGGAGNAGSTSTVLSSGGEKSEASSGGVNGTEDIYRVSAESVHWYTYWREYAKNQTKAGAQPVFTGAGTYANTSLWTGETAHDATTLLVVNATDMTNIHFLNRVTPGPLISRTILAAAMVVDPSNPDRNFTLFREYVQAYNFSNDGSQISFLTPVHSKIADQLNNGYAAITLRVQETGTAVQVQRLLFLTEDCPMFGMFGRGVDCRHCVPNAFCPGG